MSFQSKGNPNDPIYGTPEYDYLVAAYRGSCPTKECECPCHCGGYDGAGTCKQPCDSCDSSAGCPSRKTDDQKFALSRDNLVSNGWLALNHFVEDVLGIGPICGGIVGVKQYFLETQDYLRIKGWLVAMGEYDLSGRDCLML